MGEAARRNVEERHRFEHFRDRLIGLLEAADNRRRETP
jgi:hypothetical protein